MSKRIVVTGGAGFIGSCFLRKLNDAGIDNIIVVDNLGSSEKWRNLLGKRFADYVRKDDFLRMVQAGRLSDVDTVVHLGACSSTTVTDATYVIDNNYAYSRSLAVWALDAGARFIYASSAATYGDGSQGYDDDESGLERLRPLNVYGYSKHLFDLWAVRTGAIRQMAGIKFFNVFGPNEYHKGEMMSVICKRFREVRDTGVMRLFKSYHRDYGDGEQERDFVYIKDSVDVLYYIVTHREVSGIYNLGSGEARSWNDLARAMFAALGMKPRIDYIPMPEEIRPKYQYFTQAAMAKLRAAGYAGAFTPLEEAVRDYTTYLQADDYL